MATFNVIQPKARLSQKERGCDFCPSNNRKGIHKVMGDVFGRDLFIFGMAPGRDENKHQREFVGKSGKFLWKELSRVGIERKDVDVQNTVRCFTANRIAGFFEMRDPTPAEFHCCSLYTEQALAKSRARIYILLGEKAQKQVLGKEYKKTAKVFWSEKLKAKVYCLYHPSYFVRGNYPSSALSDFRKQLDAVARELCAAQETSGSLRYAYLESQKYNAITTKREALAARERLREAARKGRIIATDLEDDDIGGVRTDLCVGFSSAPGTAEVFITGHPKARKVKKGWRPLRAKVVRSIRKIVVSILTDPTIKKAMHHGSYDVPQIQRLLKVKVRGFEYDTEFAEYLSNPDGHAFGLAAIAAARYPQFIGYKAIVMPEAFPRDLSPELLKKNRVNLESADSMLAFAKKIGRLRLSQLSLRTLVLYNGADCDLTKRIVNSTQKKVSRSLLRIYTDASFVLAKMEPNGPVFDFEQLGKLRKLYPPRLDMALTKLRQMAGPSCTLAVKKKNGEWNEKKVFWKDGNFNPGSPVQVGVLLWRILKLKIPDLEGEQPSGTGKEILERLQRVHPVAGLILEYRRLSKIVSTYLNSYEECARNNDGKLRTIWKLTGTRTGRMSSGGDKSDDKGEKKLVNLQNIHGDENLQNQLTADAKWKDLYTAVMDAMTGAIGVKLFNKLQKLQKKILVCKDKEQKALLLILFDKVRKRILHRLSLSKTYRRAIRVMMAGVLGSVMVLAGYDQGQVEVRMMAQLSGDKNLIADCRKGDIHSQVGHAMTGWPVEKIKKDKKTRTLTKNIHFGILFGLGVAGLFAFIKTKDPDTDLTMERCQELYDNYFRRYPGVRRFMDKMRRFAERHGYVDNIFGFVRPLKITDDEDTGGAHWQNQCINTPVQGSAHCLMFMAMAVMIRKWKKYKSLVPTLEVHDYMGFKVPIRSIFRTMRLGNGLLTREPLRLIKREYPQVKWKIPLAVDGKVGFRYGDSIEIGKIKTLPNLLAMMGVETFAKISKLDAELLAA